MMRSKLQVSCGIIAGLSLLLLVSCSQVPEAAPPSTKTPSAVSTLAPTASYSPSPQIETTKAAPSPTVSTPPPTGRSQPAAGPSQRPCPTDLPPNPLIGIALGESDDDSRRSRDSRRMNEELKALGYQTDVLFLDTTAPDPFERNAADVAALIQAGARVLIIGQQRYQMDSAVLDQARAEGIIVIGYDGLIFNSDSVDYATGFNVAAVGRLQGEYLRDTLGLETSDASHTFEVLPDMADEFTAPILVSAWEVLGPYYASGKLTCLSKKCPSKVGNPWGVGPNTPAGEIAVASLYLRLASTYKTERLEVVLSPTSDYAISAIKALEKLGYQPGADWPILTGYSEDIGWDGTHKSLGYIMAGKQSMTVFEDSLRMATATAQMVDQILRCEPIETTHGQYDGAKNVPTLTLDPIVVTKDNIWETVITPGYYTAEQLGL